MGDQLSGSRARPTPHSLKYTRSFTYLSGVYFNTLTPARERGEGALTRFNANNIYQSKLLARHANTKASVQWAVVTVCSSHMAPLSSASVHVALDQWLVREDN